MKHLIIILALLTLYSCKKEDLNTTPYFSFDDAAKLWFSELQINDTLKFRSNLGNVRIYRVTQIENFKQVISDCYTIAGIGSCPVYFRYDERIIYFNRIDSFSSPTKIRFYMWPSDSLDYKNLPKNVIPKVKIVGNFDDYNGQLLKFPDVYQPVSFSNFTGVTRTYNEVVKFNSNNPNTYYHTGWNRNYNINEVWYDRKYGFVYFKDIFGQSWVRQN